MLERHCSPPLNKSPNTLESFDGRFLRPYGILTNLLITLEGKTVELEVEVVDANLNYNLLIERSWTHPMFCVVSSLFHVLRFPHEGKIVTVDQISFFASSSSSSNVPYVGNTNIPYESMGTGIFKDSSLMGTFTLPPPHVHSVKMISDPWIIPSEDQIESFNIVMPLSPLELNYQEFFLASIAASESYVVFSVCHPLGLVLGTLWIP